MKMIPVTWLALIALVMLIANQLNILELGLSQGIKYSLGLVGLILSLIIIAISGIQFRRHKTTVNPLSPESTSKIVKSGIYAYSRNPMYLAMLISLLSWGIILNNLASLLIAFGFVPLMNKLQISKEEAALSQLFGKEYLVYLQQVRRWL